MMADDRNPEQYTIGYGASADLISTRSAERQASFFLSHLKPGMSLLDCGCGPGSITIGLAAAVSPGQVTGIDIEQSQVDRAQATAREHNVSNVEFRVADLYELPFPDSSFDAVFASAVLEYLQDTDKALGEIKRVLKYGGVMGMRSIDIGGLLLFPESPALEDALHSFKTIWRNNGGNPHMGRGLGAAIKKAGFADVTISGQCNVMDSRTMCKIVVDVLQKPDSVERVLEQGLTTTAGLDRMVETWTEWSEHSDSLWAMPWCEVLGWKE